MSFHEFCRSHKATYQERDELAWHLAQIRARAIYKQLRPQPRYPLGAIAP